MGQGIRPVWGVRVKVRAGPGEQQAGLRRGRADDLGGVRPRPGPVMAIGEPHQSESSEEPEMSGRRRKR